jgi:hypothetical protein
VRAKVIARCVGVIGVIGGIKGLGMTAMNDAIESAVGGVVDYYTGALRTFVTSFVTSNLFVMSYELRNELRNEGRKLVKHYEALVTRLLWCYKASSL